MVRRRRQAEGIRADVVASVRVIVAVTVVVKARLRVVVLTGKPQRGVRGRVGVPDCGSPRIDRERQARAPSSPTNSTGVPMRSVTTAKNRLSISSWVNSSMRRSVRATGCRPRWSQVIVMGDGNSGAVVVCSTRRSPSHAKRTSSPQRPRPMRSAHAPRTHVITNGRRPNTPKPCSTGPRLVTSRTVILPVRSRRNEPRPTLLRPPVAVGSNSIYDRRQPTCGSTKSRASADRRPQSTCGNTTSSTHPSSAGCTAPGTSR